MGNLKNLWELINSGKRYVHGCEIKLLARNASYIVLIATANQKKERKKERKKENKLCYFSYKLLFSSGGGVELKSSSTHETRKTEMLKIKDSISVQTDLILALNLPECMNKYVQISMVKLV